MSLHSIVQEKIWSIVPDHASAFFTRLLSPDIVSRDVTSFYSEQDVASAYTITDDGTALLQVRGILLPEADAFDKYFGAASMAELRAQLRHADANAAVQQAVLVIDSPGGVVPGVVETANVVRAFSKPLSAFSGGLMASAAYWIGSAVNAGIHILPTTQIGSIGVLQIHVNADKFFKDRGLDISIFTAGKYKALGNPYETVSELGKADIQEKLDDIYALFKTDVGLHRGMDDHAVENMADGRVFLGTKGVAIGLADKLVHSIDEHMRYMQPRKHMMSTQTETSERKETIIMTLDELKANNPDLIAAIQSEERTRIQTIFDIAPAGCKAKATELAFTTNKSAADCGIDFLLFQKNNKAAVLQAMAEESPEPVAVTAATTATHEDDTPQLTSVGVSPVMLAAVVANNVKKNPARFAQDQQHHSLVQGAMAMFSR